MVSNNHLRDLSLTTPEHSRLDSLAIDSVRTAKARRIRDQSMARYMRRRSALLYVRQYCKAKWPDKPPGLTFRITIDSLRRAGFWHRNPRQPRAARVYYEDLVHLEEQALMLCTRLDHIAARTTQNA